MRRNVWGSRAWLVLLGGLLVACGTGLGEVGESCQSRRDCRGQLRCVDNVCADEGGLRRLGGVGETCVAGNDCADTLICVNSVCIESEFDVAQTAGRCELIECSTTAECCPPLSDFCRQAATDCAGGNAFACDQFEALCRCLEACEDERCVFRCEFNEDCGFGGVCVGGRCQNCADDNDCFGDLVCIEGLCTVGCESNTDCGFFNECRSGECVAVGCRNDRECIAFTENANAVCRDEGSCAVPCRNDVDCNPFGYRFQECQEGTCIQVGCETDEECRIFLNVRPGSDFSAVCREP